MIITTWGSFFYIQKEDDINYYGRLDTDVRIKPNFAQTISKKMVERGDYIVVL